MTEGADNGPAAASPPQMKKSVDGFTAKKVRGYYLQSPRENGDRAYDYICEYY